MDNFSFKRLYLQLDEATVSFNGDPDMVRFVICFTACMQYFPKGREIVFSVCLSVHREEGTPGFWLQVTGPWSFSLRLGAVAPGQACRDTHRQDLGVPPPSPPAPPVRTRTGLGGTHPPPPLLDQNQNQTLHLLFRLQRGFCGHAGALSCYIMEIANGAMCQYFRWEAREFLKKF